MTDKPPMPDSLRALAVAAQTRVRKLRAVGPVVEGHVHREQGYLVSPWAEEDWELWVHLLLDAFGTRSIGVAQEFMFQLRQTVPSIWSHEHSHHPDPCALEQALHIVSALKPRDEAETAIAVNAVAVFFAARKLTDHMGSRSYLDPKSAAALAAITASFSAQVKALREMQSPKRAKRQVIKVQKNVQVNYTDARQVHLPGGGSGNSSGQPDATRAQRAHARNAGGPVELPALPSPDQGGEVLSFPCREGEARLQDARRGSGKRGAEG